jgi:hypothetical protein
MGSLDAYIPSLRIRSLSSNVNRAFTVFDMIAFSLLGEVNLLP